MIPRATMCGFPRCVPPSIPLRGRRPPRGGGDVAIIGSLDIVMGEVDR